MVALRATEVDAALSRLDPARPVILVYGPDSGLVSERVAALLALGAQGGDPAFSRVDLEGDAVAADPASLADEAHTVALFGGRRVVRVRLGGRAIAGAVEPLLRTPPRDAIVIIEAGDLKRDHALRAMIERAPNALAVPCYADGARDIARLIDQELDAAGLAIDRDARELLAGLLGGDRLASRGEIRKLALYCHGAARVTRADVEAVVGDASATGLDDALDAAFSGQAAALETALARLAGQGVNPQSLIAAGLRHAATLHRLSLAVASGGAPERVVENARPPVHFRRKAAVQSALSRWSPATLSAAMIDLGEAAAQARKRWSLAAPIVARALLSIAMRAAPRGRR